MSAHAGVLTYLGDPPVYLPDQTFDWRFGATRQFGPWGIHLDVSGRILGRKKDLPYGVVTVEDQEVVVLSLTRAF